MKVLFNSVAATGDNFLPFHPMTLHWPSGSILKIALAAVSDQGR
jgi:hypothetical protein